MPTFPLREFSSGARNPLEKSGVFPLQAVMAKLSSADILFFTPKKVPAREIICHTNAGTFEGGGLLFRIFLIGQVFAAFCFMFKGKPVEMFLIVHHSHQHGQSLAPHAKTSAETAITISYILIYLTYTDRHIVMEKLAKKCIENVFPGL